MGMTALCSLPIVIMDEATEHIAAVNWAISRTSLDRYRASLAKTLMGPSFIIILHILG